MPNVVRMCILALLACSGVLPCANAEQSLVLEPGTVGEYRIGAADIPNGVADFRVEFRLHDFGGCEENYTNIWDFGVIRLRCHVAGLNQLGIADGAASVGFTIDMSERTDAIFRVQRDAVAGELTAEVWNADGSGYLRLKRGGASIGPRNVAGRHEVGGRKTRVKIAWMRWLGSRIPLGSPLPTRQSEVGGDLLGEWQFESDSRDSGVRHLDLSISLKFANSPIYPPIAAPRVSQGATPITPVVRAAQTFTLHGLQSRAVSSDGIVEYLWEQISGPSQVEIVSPSSAITDVEGAIAGEYRFRLTVVDQVGAEGSELLTVGVVAADERDVISQTGSGLGFILGPQIRLGASPWPYLDHIHQDLADSFGPALDEEQWSDDFNVALPGSVNLPTGSSIVFGAGTSFQTQFCGEAGGTEPTGVRFVVWYPRMSGGLGRRAYGVASCPSQQELHLTSPYLMDSGGDPARIQGLPQSFPLKHSKMACLGCWINQSNNINYYDGVLAFYSLYSRSGLERYRTFARKLADRWWSMPFIDEGGCLPGNCVAAPRMWSLAGMIARAVDGRPEMWAGIRKFLDVAVVAATRPVDLVDIREEAYYIAFLSIGAQLDPDEQSRERYRAAVIQAMEQRWIPQQQPDGNWINFSYGYLGRNSTPPSGVDTENGSSSIIGVGTQGYLPKNTNRNWILVSGDSDAYFIMPGSDDQTLLLDRPYQGPTGVNRSYQLNNLVGYGTQPFTMGIVATAWSYAFRATGDPRARQLVLDAASWIAVHGVRSGTRGLYYARIYPPCEPDPDSAPNCASGPAGDPGVKSGERFLNGEVINAFSQAYLLSGTGTYRVVGDDLTGAALGSEGGPNADTSFATELDETASSTKWKNFGFFFGFGFASSYPAARIEGSPAYPARRTPTTPIARPTAAPRGEAANREIQK